MDHDAHVDLFCCVCPQVFEWWYFKKYGTSFIEQVSLNHLSPLLGGADPPLNGPSSNGPTENGTANAAGSTQQSVTG
jgi:hypothetical protein